MANWCENRVHFTGERYRVEAVQQIFKEIEQHHDTKQWHLPDFVTAALCSTLNRITGQ